MSERKEPLSEPMKRALCRTNVWAAYSPTLDALVSRGLIGRDNKRTPAGEDERLRIEHEEAGAEAYGDERETRGYQ